MNAQWKKFSSAALKRKRTAKTKAKLRKELYNMFYSRYIIASGIYHADQLGGRSSFSKTELEHLRGLRAVEGGQYHVQVEKETKQLEFEL